MKKIIQSSCSELLVDTRIFDAKEAYEKFIRMFNNFEWDTEPKLSFDLLKKLIEESELEEFPEHRTEIMVYDKDGNKAWIEYGNNGYIMTGFRFDSHCNHSDSQCFPIFWRALREFKKEDAELISCDGGSTELYEDWENGKDMNEE